MTISMLHHNRPPVSETLADHLSDLGDLVTKETAALAARRDEFLANCDAIPEVIDSDELDGRVNDQIAQWTKYIKEVDRWKDETKTPILTADRLIMATRAKLADPIEQIKRRVNERSTIYKRAKMERERQAREAAAAEAARIAAEAERAAQDQSTLQTAIDAAAAAEAAQQAAAAKASDLSRNRGDWGSVSSLQTFWDFADLDRNAIDLEALRPHLALDAIEKAVRAAIKSGARQMRGVRIFENTRNSGRG
jgi:regulator of protease activity HflC (stomatin/prohibitin superfamily)